MRILSCVLFHGIWRPPVGVPFAQDGINGASLHLVVTRPDSLLFIISGIVGIVRQGIVFFLKLCNRRLKLWDRSADIRQFDDVSLWLLREFTEFRQRIQSP